MKCWQKFRSRLFVQIILLIVGIAALISGIYRGEVETVLTKAIYICLECISIG